MVTDENNIQLKKDLVGFFEEESTNLDSNFTPPDPKTSQFYCDAMNDVNINMALNNVKPELILLLGFEDYGKSTFVGSLYSYLLFKGGIDGYELYDSDTFSGFERRFYLRNIKNDKNAKSKTLRTEEDDEYLLTLTLYNPSSKDKKQLIISDRAGETYRKYTDVKDRIRNDMSFSSARRILIFLDATQINDGWDIQHGRFKQLFAGLKENGKMPANATFTLLFNKIDLVNKSEDLSNAYKRYKNEIEDFFKEELGLSELMSIEMDSKHTHDNIQFENLVKDLIKKNETLSNEEKKLKKTLDWVSEKLK